jgi:hypothetical protein
MIFRKLKKYNCAEVYHYYDNNYGLIFYVIALPCLSNNDDKYYYIKIKQNANIILYDSIRDDHKTFRGLDNCKKAILNWLNKDNQFGKQFNCQIEFK